MPRAPLPDHFYKSLQGLQDNSLSPQESQQLQALLLSNPDARQVYYDAVDIDLGITEIAAGLRHQQFPLPVAGTRRNRRFLSAFKYGSVAAACLLIGFFVNQFLVHRQILNSNPVRQLIAATIPDNQYFATLVRSTDCDWEDVHSPYFAGKRLLSSELHLRRGVAEFRFDSGVRLVIEGPTQLKINSQQNAFLQFGKVVLHGHELAEGFRLETPRGMLTDIGTEYGTTVDQNQNVELHVFQGSVLVEPASALEGTNVVEAGAARRLGSETIEPVPLRPELFQREVPVNPNDSRLSQDGLLAYEPFLPTTLKNGQPDWRVGGIGWKDSWQHTAPVFTPSKATFDAKLSLEFPKLRNLARDGALRLMPAGHIAARKLEQAVRMDTDAIYYLSFYLQKQTQAPPKTFQYGSVSLRDSTQPGDAHRIVCGMNSDCFPMLLHNEQQLVTAPPLKLGEPYLFVAKIVANEQAPDQIMLRVFMKDEEIPDQDPLIWTSISQPQYDDTVFDKVLIYTEGVEYVVDELRLTSTWEMATHLPDSLFANKFEAAVRKKSPAAEKKPTDRPEKK